MRVLALDIGTSSARAHVYDERAECIAGRQEHYTSTRGHSGRTGEFDAEELLATAREAMDEAQQEAGGEVDAVAISCFWHSLVGVDAGGHGLLQPAELSLGGDEVGRAREGVLPQGVPAEPGRALVVQCDACALLPGQLAALQLHLADERPQERRLPGAVRP